MIVSSDQTIIQLILNASPVVKAVMGLLALVSVYSWTVMFYKRSVIRKANKQAEQFQRRFWSGVELGELYRKVSERREKLHGLEAIFESGFREFVHLKKQAGNDPGLVMEGAVRAMRVAMNREYEYLEHHLSFLATVGSTSPYVGLLGTVWGIMNAFLGLGQGQAVSFEKVAGGIAEALIATAIGLCAAIPAVIAYNRFANDVERVMGRYNNFIEEFSTVLQRQARTGA